MTVDRLWDKDGKRVAANDDKATATTPEKLPAVALYCVAFTMPAFDYRGPDGTPTEAAHATKTA